MPRSADSLGRFRGPAARAAGPDFLRLLRRCLLVTALILLAAQAATALIAAHFLEKDLLPELHRRTELIGASVADRLSYAVSLGMPLPALVGVDRYLAEVLKANPDLTYLALTTLEGTVLAIQGSERFAGAGMAVPAADAARSPVTRRIGDHFDTRLVLTDHERPVGHLHLGQHVAVERSLALLPTPALPVVLVVVFLLAAELLTLVLRGQCAVAWGWLRAGLRRIGAGDFSHRPVLPRHHLFGGIAANMAGLVTDLNDRFEQLSDEAEEIKAGQLDRTVPARIEAEVEPVRTAYRFVPPGEEVPIRPLGVSRLRLPLLFLFGAIGLPLTHLMDAAWRLHPWSDWIGVEAVAAHPLALLFGTAGVLLLLLRFTGFLGFLWNDPRAMLALAGLLGMVAVVCAWFAAFTAALTLWSVFNGLALGLSVQAAERTAARANADVPSARGLGTVLVAAMVALACTAPLGGLILAVGQPLHLWAVSGVLGLICFLLSVWLAPGAAQLHRVEPAEPLARIAAEAGPVKAALAGARSGGTVGATLVALLAIYPLSGLVGGYVFYLLSLLLDGFGTAPQIEGRVMMAFGITGLLAVPLWRHLRPQPRAALWGLAGSGMLAGGTVAAGAWVTPAAGLPMAGLPADAAGLWLLAASLSLLALCLAFAVRMAARCLARPGPIGAVDLDGMSPDPVVDPDAVSLGGAGAAIAAPALLFGLAGGPFTLALAVALWGLPTAILLCGGFAMMLSALLVLLGPFGRRAPERSARAPEG